MSRTPGLRQLRRRKTTRLDRADQQHDHTHALFRALVLAAVLVVLAVSGVLQRESSGVRATQAGASADVSADHAAGDSPAWPVAASRSAPDVEYLPLVTVAAAYPAAAEAAGITGRCTVEFTVTASGTTDAVRAVDCRPVGVFESSAVVAARAFKYRPRLRAGQPVEARGVRNEFVFSLEH